MLFVSLHKVKLYVVSLPKPNLSITEKIYGIAEKNLPVQTEICLIQNIFLSSGDFVFTYVLPYIVQ